MSSYGSPPSSGGFGPPPGGHPPGGGGFGPPGGGGFGPGGGTPPPGGPYGAPSGGGPMGPGGPRTDALAIVALVAGLLAIVGAIGNLVTAVFGMCCPLCTIGGAVIGAMVAVPALAGIVTGVVSYRRTAEQPETYAGKGLALTGAITGGLAILMTVGTIVGPWLGFGCMAATAPDRPGTYDPGTYDPAPNPFDPQPDPAPTPGIDPQPGTAQPTAAQPTAAQPTAAGGACARIAPCCRAYIDAMGGTVPATTCDAYNDVTGMPDSVCESAISGYRSGLTAMNKAVPTECN